MRKMTVGIIAGLLLLAVACNSRALLIGGGAENINIDLPESVSYNDYEARREVKENNPVGNDFYEAFDAFAYESAALALEASDKNEAFSPASLFYALAIASQGAAGQTQKELLDLLGMADEKKLAAECSNLYRLIYVDNEIGRLKLSNSLWLSDKAAFKPSFVESAARNFYAETFRVDFTSKEAAQKISGWISDNTGGKLAPEIMTDPDQLVSIINTIWLKDEWMIKFDEAKSAGGSFKKEDGSTLACDFMSGRRMSEFSRGENYTRAALELKNSGQMVFVLPNEGVSVSELLRSGESLREALEGGNKERLEVDFKIPKFDFKSEFDLIDGLKALGVSSAFEKNADFSNMTENPAYISKIKQQSALSIDEKGVEAAAFTAIDVVATGAPVEEHIESLVLDRPFVFAIITAEGAPLFIGACADPSQE